MFSQLVYDYKNDSRPKLTFNVLKAFKQLEAAEVDPPILAYSIILSKDSDNYQCYTPQYKIGKSLNRESGSLIKFYKTGQQEDGYSGYSTDYRDLNIDVYKIELWKLVREVLRLLDCDIQKLEDQIFPTITEDDLNGENTTRLGAAYSSDVFKKPPPSSFILTPYLGGGNPGDIQQVRFGADNYTITQQPPPNPDLSPRTIGDLRVIFGGDCKQSGTFTATGIIAAGNSQVCIIRNQYS